MSLQSLKRRLHEIEAKAAHMEIHLVMVFVGTPQLNAEAHKSVLQGEQDARRMGKKLRIFEVEVS
jgi:hypothetical protein